MKPDFATLHNLYVIQKMTRQEVANHLGVNKDTISRWLKSAGIPVRNIRDFESRGMTKPTKEVLRDLYIAQRMTTRQIATHLDFAPTSIKNWLREYKIERRPSNNGLIARGIPEPTKEELENLVHIQHLSYDEIAGMFHVDRTAVPYWLKKHGISRPKTWDTIRKGNTPTLPTEQDLRDLYGNGTSLVTIGKMYGVSATPIRDLCTKFNITIRPDGFNGGRRYECEDGHLVRSVYEQRVDNWLYQHGIKHSIEPRLPFNKHCKADFFANGWYIEIWGVIQNKDYTERRKRKIKGYQSHNLPLIEIEVHNFVKRQTMSDQWTRKLQKVLEPPFIAATLLDFA